jgi:hypothetical protein
LATQYIQKFESTAAFLASAPDNGVAQGLGFVSDVAYVNDGGAAVPVTLGIGRVITPTAAVTLTAEQSGSEIMLNASAGFAITLPAVAAGLRYRFTVAAAFASTNFTVITPALADIIQGGATVAGSDVPAADEDTISFVASAELKGDFVDVWSDGTSWFVNGRGTTAGSITFTQAG